MDHLGDVHHKALGQSAREVLPYHHTKHGDVLGVCGHGVGQGRSIRSGAASRTPQTRRGSCCP
ncbi:uncharacterized protein J3R85_007908 [Psidium guajava]|nr:uncharacterized protein J3R85_007908 [Psidium guajava]